MRLSVPGEALLCNRVDDKQRRLAGTLWIVGQPNMPSPVRGHTTESRVPKFAIMLSLRVCHSLTSQDTEIDNTII